MTEEERRADDAYDEGIHDNDDDPMTEEEYQEMLEKIKSLASRIVEEIKKP